MRKSFCVVDQEWWALAIGIQKQAVSFTDTCSEGEIGVHGRGIERILARADLDTVRVAQHLMRSLFHFGGGLEGHQEVRESDIWRRGVEREGK